MKTRKATAKVQTAAKVSLADQLKQKAETSNKYRILIPVSYLLEFDPKNPVTETVMIMGQPRKCVRWNVFVDNKAAIAVLQVGQIGRLYQAILEENLPEGVELDESKQCVAVLTDKFTTNQRGIQNPNGSLGFLNLSPLTVAASGVQQEVSGFQFAE